MQLEYLECQILSASSDAGEIVMRLDTGESELPTDPAPPVLSMRLKVHQRSMNVLPMLIQHIFNWAEFTFYEDEVKHLEITFDYSEDTALRIDYSECTVSKEDYTVDDVAGKLKHLQQVYDSQVEQYHKEAVSCRRVIHRLRQEFQRELDRFERKRDFFAGAGRAEQYEIGCKCYQRALDLIDRLEKDEAV